MRTATSVQLEQMYSMLLMTFSSTMRFLLASLPSAQLQSAEKAAARAASSTLVLSGPTVWRRVTRDFMAPFEAMRGLLEEWTAREARVLQHCATIGAFGFPSTRETHAWIPLAAAIAPRDSGWRAR